MPRFPALALLAFASCTALAQAPLFRSYLASTGDDTNTCTRQAPCRLLPAAIAATAAGGEVWMLDSANYNTGPVLIDKSINILAVPGAVGSVVGNGGNAIEVNAPGAKVALRNLVFLNLAGGTNAVLLTDAIALRVEGCEIYGFNLGLYLKAPATAAVIDTVIRDNAQGIALDNGVKATISRSHVIGNFIAGLIVNPTAGAETSAYVSGSVLNHNGYGAIIQGSAARFAIVHMRDSVVSGNANSGLFVQGTAQANDGGSLYLSSTAVNRNSTGLEIQSGAVFSAGDNRVVNNRVADRTVVNNSGTYLVTSSM